MDDPDITMEEYIWLETEKALRKGKVYNWETATYGKFRYDEDVHFLRSVETEFPAIVYNDALTSKLELSCEPTSCWHPDAFTTHNLAHKRNMEDHTEQIPEEFLVLILLISCS
ncbi:hypothetical protein Tco_1212326 [Tanacetum coccineum]